MRKILQKIAKFLSRLFKRQTKASRTGRKKRPLSITEQRDRQEYLSKTARIKRLQEERLAFLIKAGNNPGQKAYQKVPALHYKNKDLPDLRHTYHVENHLTTVIRKLKKFKREGGKIDRFTSKDKYGLPWPFTGGGDLKPVLTLTTK